MYTEVFIERLLKAKSIEIDDTQYSQFLLNVKHQIVVNNEVIFNFSGFFVKSFNKKGNQWVIVEFLNDNEDELEIKLVY